MPLSNFNAGPRFDALPAQPPPLPETPSSRLSNSAAVEAIRTAPRFQAERLVAQARERLLTLADQMKRSQPSAV